MRHRWNHIEGDFYGSFQFRDRPLKVEHLWLQAMGKIDDCPTLQACQLGRLKHPSGLQDRDQLLDRRADPNVADVYCLGLNAGKPSSDVRHGKLDTILLIDV
jgi:hypothetical protein